MKKEMENETKNVNTEISDDELEQAVGAVGPGSVRSCTCPKCSSEGLAIAQLWHSSYQYLCMNCGHKWVE